MRQSFLKCLLALAMLFALPTVLLAAEEAHGTTAGASEPEASLLRPPGEGAITAVTTLVVFILLVVLLGRFAWGPIASGLKKREDQIRKDISDAEAARARAEATLKEYTAKLASAEGQIREMLGKATTDAEKIATNLKMQAQQDSEEIKERATREIESAKNDAVREVHAQTAELATSVAEKILRRNLNVEDQRGLVNESLSQLIAVKN